MFKGPAVGAGLELVARDAELPGRDERDQLQLLDQRLREGPAVGAGAKLVTIDAELPAGTRRDELQLRNQRLREGPAVGACLELVARDVEHLAATERDHYNAVCCGMHWQAANCEIAPQQPERAGQTCQAGRPQTRGAPTPAG